MSAVLLAYYVLLFVTVFAWPTWRLWRRERVNALVLPSEDTAEGVIGRWFKGLIAAVGVLVTMLAFGLSPREIGGTPWLEATPLQAIGWFMLAASLGWMAVAQAHMGRAWRIGIDRANTPFLAREGVFNWSRNPIFLGLRLNLTGLFLVAPNAASLAILLVGEALIQVQVRLEEQYLAHAFGSDYSDYRRAVRRWL